LDSKSQFLAKLLVKIKKLNSIIVKIKKNLNFGQHFFSFRPKIFKNSQFLWKFFSF